MKIGWIGTGTTGKPMVSHLIKAGNDVIVYNRTLSKCDDLTELGAKVCTTPKEVTEKADIIFTMLGFPSDVENVYFGENGILSGVNPGKILIDMTTSSPRLAKRIYDDAKEKGAFSLDAPIEGDDLAARKKTLHVMAGGDEEIFEDVYQLFMTVAENATYMGEAGSGQNTKMANQILIADTMIGVVESLLYAYKTGLDLKKVIGVIGKGTASSWSINNLGRRIIKKKFNPGFYIKHFVKDMGIILEESERMRLALPGLSLVRQFYIAAMNLGMENLGTQGIYKVFAKMNGIDL
ncbi:NAD(P)-dependent oxidoreductase [Promethearchaeum syntrophicum]|uniref:NAD(P)-dependent oxidoreductase n=1 Tax=Promethearchaeum syntrophicum TaxID=2594042 RepID=A0A5B9D7P2_9ARCH|nr:NAD(P)-dependent oxidoreductase [Candidatus Prometheoarchaeum syntrophicum]QEE15043.1 tartronate semialdehyde reductase [Candidatus Prometheoarchaeum syntrophicum]